MTCPPSMTRSFTEELLRRNRLWPRGFQGWSFLPGMLFGATTTWWPGRSPVRPRPHEGLDLSRYVDANGALAILAPGTMVPVLGRGQVVAIFADFLGQSILVGHDLEQGGARFHSIYAHVTPETGVTIGHHCLEAEVIGRIAASRRPGVPPHLHLSTLWLAGPLAGELSWLRLNSATGVRLCDPLELIGD